MRSQQGTCAGILDQIVVPADQDRHSNTPGRIEDGVTFAALDQGMLEGMQLAMSMARAIVEANPVGVVEAAILAAFQPADTDRDPDGRCELCHFVQRRAIRRFGQLRQIGCVQLGDMPVAGDAHLRHENKFSACFAGTVGERLYPRKVIVLVARPVLELDCCYAQL